MPSCKAVIFDLDGTLCYTFEDILTSMNETLGVLSYPQITRQRLLEIINNGSKNLVRKALPGFAADDESLFSEAYDLYDAIYALHCAESTTLYDGIAEAVSELKAAGLRLGVNTNKQDGQSKMLMAKLLPPGTFDFIVGAGEIYPVKPDPTAAVDMVTRLDIRPDETVYCGDSDVDIKTALNAGMFPLGVSWGYRDRAVLEENGAGYIAEKPSDIVGFILK